MGLDTDLHLDHTNVAPSWSGTYLLGSDHLGRDVLAMLLSGTKFSIAISLFSALLASIIGVAIGILSGFYGDTDGLLCSRIFSSLGTAEFSLEKYSSVEEAIIHSGGSYQYEVDRDIICHSYLFFAIGIVWSFFSFSLFACDHYWHYFMV